jgi:4'-phosphopantetheinyl transferase
MMLDHGIHLVISHIEFGKINYNEIKGYLSAQELLKLSSYYFYEDRVRFLLGRYIIKIQLAKYLNCKPLDINIQYNNYGRPLISTPNIHFNISHSLDFVVVAFDKHPIGIDIEYNIKFDNDLINQVFFTENEILYLNSLPYESKRKEFFKIWTYKEAYIKAIGMGMSANPNLIDVINISENSLRYNNEVYKIKTIKEIDSKYSCAICYSIKTTSNISILYLEI